MLKIFDIEQLKEGMFVDSIAKQQGKINITSRGLVTSYAAIEQLKKKGILSVVVDMSKSLGFEDVEQQPKTLEITPKISNEVSFEVELEVATKLHAEGKHLQKNILNSVSKNLPIDIAIPEAFTNNLVSSISRNPNALMCMTKIREKDNYLLEHSLNVAILLATFATHVGLKEAQVQELALSGFLHDVGKIKIPSKILDKPGLLDDQEMTIMRDHVYFSTKFLLEMGISEAIVLTISQHRERLDGYGYPGGLRGDEIKQFGRMIAIVDTYDAITADRCYKASVTSKKALQILLQEAPEKYDQKLVSQFVQCIGIFPAGSLVKLSNEKIALVIKQHPLNSANPVVKIFYSVQDKQYLEPKELNLATASNGVKIVEAVIASDFKLDFNKYFNESIVI